MSNFIKRYTMKILDRLANTIAARLSETADQTQQRDGNDRVLQILLSQHYQRLVQDGSQLPAFRDVEFSSYSQNGEDGILLFIFSVIGTQTRRVVEICAGDGIECNAANLIINHGWTGLLFDGNKDAIERGNAFYAQRTNAWRFHRLPPTLVPAWVTTENVNDLIRQHGMAGEIDLLSLDMDGVDYWMWKAIDAIDPRVVILEYNNRWNSKHSVTVPDQVDFVGQGASEKGEGYFGASLLAFTKLAREKGYRLIGANSPNTNALFMRKDVGNELFPEVSVETCLGSDYAIHQQKTRYPLIKDMPVIQI